MPEKSCPFHAMGPSVKIENFGRNSPRPSDRVPTYYPEGTRGQSIMALLFLSPAIDNFLSHWRQIIVTQESTPEYFRLENKLRDCISAYINTYKTDRLQLKSGGSYQVFDTNHEPRGLRALIYEAGIFSQFIRYLTLMYEFDRVPNANEGHGFYNANSKVSCPAQKIVMDCILPAAYYNMLLSKAGIELQRGSVSITHDSEAAPFGRKFCTLAQILQQYETIVKSASKAKMDKRNKIHLWSRILACIR